MVKKLYLRPRCYVIVSRKLATDPKNRQRRILMHDMIVTENHTYTKNFFSPAILSFDTKNNCCRYISRHLKCLQKKVDAANGQKQDWLIPVMFKNIKMLKRCRDGYHWISPYNDDLIRQVDTAEHILKSKKYEIKKDIKSNYEQLKRKNCPEIEINGNSDQSKHSFTLKTEKFFLKDKTTGQYLIKFTNMFPELTQDIQEASYFTNIGQAQSVINKISDLSFWNHLTNLRFIIVNEKGNQVTFPIPETKQFYP